MDDLDRSLVLAAASTCPCCSTCHVVISYVYYVYFCPPPLLLLLQDQYLNFVTVFVSFCIFYFYCTLVLCICLSIFGDFIFLKIKRKRKHVHELTVGGHKETSVDLFGVTEVWLDLIAADIELPLMDAAGSDIQHIKTILWMTGRGQILISLSVCVFNI